MLDDDGIAEHELEEALLAASGSASSPSPSPDTPDPGTHAERVQVIDVDDLPVDEEQIMREAVGARERGDGRLARAVGATRGQDAGHEDASGHADSAAAP